ncbi:DUF1002 domain-containing protein [Clostridium botulinum]|uniref:DUF1002 domain-containing protein n=1 Tax=Clostridium botulinum C/D str. DC5 TaxID=1443128 RepID=A0A0A0IJ39_CLOBO|nr:DUF1002 domain-containing protein [Clostridium botulinum]KGM94401.1 hypothetical protein Z956_07765 [Clostridium botulinum D str. CCUG 7971]KGN00232.1 hypothetical protein Z955_04345 [Clostridium botulinum C/D str. DC5]KOC50169.1 hypothetical protein ADU89_14690 [Clostridium botulinum]KOC50625.1 hypothetical protein ADU88_01735 [Clostridium botulinum]KOC57663.1 hypothetical protein ADU90_04605 [Clostridium botulinum]
MRFKKSISRILVLLFTISIIASVQVKNAYADAFKVVTLGADLNSKQKEDMLKYFAVNKNEANIIEVTNKEENNYLKDVASKKQIGTKAISCSYVEPSDEGGLKISTHNMYWVTESMIRNALITAGIENANVKASAPFNVSGTAALTGILKGFESSKGGKKIDEKKKKAANEEIVVTGDLGEKIGKDEAASLVNQVKKDVIKEKPKNEEEIKNIVLNVTNSFNKNSDKNLSEEDVQKITSLMNKINGLDLNFKQLKDQLNDVTEKLKGTITSDEARGFFTKLWDSIAEFFSNLFSSHDSKDKSSNDKNEDQQNKDKNSTSTSNKDVTTNSDNTK